MQNETDLGRPKMSYFRNIIMARVVARCRRQNNESPRPPIMVLNLIHVTPRSRITQTGTPPRHVKDVMDPWGQGQAMHAKYLRSMALQCFEAIYSDHIIKNHHRRQRSNPLILLINYLSK